MNAQTLERPVLDESQLNMANRCDACDARIQVRVTVPSSGQPYFCGHHASEYLPSLVGGGTQILDERYFMSDQEQAPRSGGTHGLQARAGINGPSSAFRRTVNPYLPSNHRNHTAQRVKGD